jgi:hypothetical protein
MSDVPRNTYMVTVACSPSERMEETEFGRDITFAEWAQHECERWWEKNYRRCWVDVVPGTPGHIAIWTDSYDHIEQGPEA